MKRDPLGVLFLSALVVVAAGLAGITRAPDARWVHIVSGAAVIGPWLERLADLYRRPAEDATGFEVMEEVEDGREIVYELDLEKFEARPRVWVQQGTGMFEQPSETSRRLAVLPVTTNLLLFDRRGDWYWVRFKAQKGWVLMPAYDESTTPPLGSEADLPLPVPARPPDPEVLAMAVELLEKAPEPDALGPYTLSTDVGDRALLSDLSDLADRVESVYTARYGLTPLPGVAEVVVLFASRDSYRRFRQASPETRFLAAPGLVRDGVVATYVGDRSRNEIASTVVHELTHLVNRRALGPALPPWLEEGLADDLAQSRIEGRDILPGKLGGSFRRSGARTDYEGGLAAALELQGASSGGTLPSLETLVALDWKEFQAGEHRSLRYGQASFFVRSLLDSPDPTLARGFRAFLGDVSCGQPLTPEALRTRLDRSWSALDRQLDSFIRRQLLDEGASASAESGSSSRQASEPSS